MYSLNNLGLIKRIIKKKLIKPLHLVVFNFLTSYQWFFTSVLKKKLIPIDDSVLYAHNDDLVYLYRIIVIFFSFEFLQLWTRTT